jgi:hypothetical protein
VLARVQSLGYTAADLRKALGHSSTAPRRLSSTSISARDCRSDRCGFDVAAPRVPFDGRRLGGEDENSMLSSLPLPAVLYFALQRLSDTHYRNLFETLQRCQSTGNKDGWRRSGEEFR